MVWCAMAKTKTPEQLALSEAVRKPERRWKVNRNCAWYFSSRWSFFTNYRGLSLSVGDVAPKAKVHGDEVPEYVLGVTLDVRPYRVLLFWRGKRRIWWGAF